MARWNSCNLLHVAPDAKRLWQFDAKGGSFVLAREQRVPHTETMPAKLVAKSWSSLWQPKLNLAWLPPENVFLRVIELPAANAEETFSMVELQLEKLSPIPVSQAVWTMHALGTHASAAKADGTAESLQTVMVILAARSAVEEFLGKLEKEGYLADRLEVPMLDQLEAVAATGDGVWLFPFSMSGQNAALVAWRDGGALRSLSFVTLPAAGDRAAELQQQLSLLMMAGEVEGWLTSEPKWNLVADPANATEWETVLHAATGGTATVIAPPAPAELALRTTKRAAVADAKVNLLPLEFSTRYHQQFIDRLWLTGLGWAGAAYAVCLVIYFCAVGFRGYQAHGVEAQVAAISQNYTNVVELKAKYSVLQERAQLKYAALDVWKVVAQQTPPGLTIQRMGFTEGRRLALSGTTTPDLINTLLDFDQSLRKVQVNNQPVFDMQAGEHVNPRTPQGSQTTTWSLTTELLHTEKDAP